MYSYEKDGKCAYIVKDGKTVLEMSEIGIEHDRLCKKIVLLLNSSGTLNITSEKSILKIESLQKELESVKGRYVGRRLGSSRIIKN